MSTDKNDSSDFAQFSLADDDYIVSIFNGAVNESSTMRLAERISKAIKKRKHVIIQRAFQLGLLPYQEFAHWLLSHRENGWRSDEIEFLIANPDKSRKDLAIVLGRTVQSVSKQCFELKLNNGGYLYSWSPSDLRVLKSSYQKLSIKELSKTLGRCSVDIKYKMLELGLVDKRSYVQFTGRPTKLYSC